MKASRVEPQDADTLRAWYAAGLAAHRHDRPDAPYFTEREAVVMVTEPDAEERIQAFVVRNDDDTVVGSGVVFVPLLDNLDKAYFVLSVVPGHRGRGAGDAGVEHVLEVVRDEGRGIVLGEGFFPLDADDTHPVRAFALRHGFRLANTEIRRTLALPLSEGRLRGWAQEAARHHAGYDIHTYDDLVPEELVPSLVDLFNQLMVDAPTGEIDFGEGGMSVEVYTEQVERRRATGRRVLVSVAVRDGRTVAQSTLSIPPEGHELPHMNQWGTFVDRAHRGHRLGLAVKVANLREVQRRHPERTLIHTTNSPVNGPMVAINEELGFVPVEVLGEFMRTL